LRGGRATNYWGQDVPGVSSTVLTTRSLMPRFYWSLDSGREIFSHARNLKEKSRRKERGNHDNDREGNHHWKGRLIARSTGGEENNKGDTKIQRKRYRLREGGNNGERVWGFREETELDQRGKTEHEENKSNRSLPHPRMKGSSKKRGQWPY